MHQPAQQRHHIRARVAVYLRQRPAQDGARLGRVGDLRQRHVPYAEQPPLGARRPQHHNVAVPRVALDTLERSFHGFESAFQHLREASLAVEQRPGHPVARVIPTRYRQDARHFHSRITLLAGDRIAAAINETEQVRAHGAFSRFGAGAAPKRSISAATSPAGTGRLIR